jgi:glycosyltransferase involved in cell wall biosynthesis
VRVFHIQTRTVNEKGRFAYLWRILRFMAVSAAFLGKRHLCHRYDVIHVHSVPDFLVFAAIVPKLLGARVILDIHDILPEFYSSKFHIAPGSIGFRLLLLCERFSTAFADHVIVANELWRDRLVSRSTRPDKCIAIRNYPDPRIFFTRAERSRSGKFLILYPGSLNYHQGVDVALRAFARVTRIIPEAEFYIYGEGPDLGYLVSLRHSLGLEACVHIEGFLSAEKIAERMAAADLAVVPKRASSTFGNEAASTKIMEFMALGVPVVVSRTKIDSFYHDDSMVQFVTPEDEADLANSIVFLRNHPERRAELVHNAFAYLRLHNWEHKKFEYLRLVDALVSPGSSNVEYEVHA